ncbi:hypothetical protein KSP40_PGU021875 [Platanthera guangdongensis]|uniref:Uncharacterized protein n=1 Tax=Platanthera guangdongensis TaxID=2320717 RepID=A0ABR2MYN0_9ASPA
MKAHSTLLKLGLDTNPVATIKMYFWCREVGSAEIEFEGREASLHSKILTIKGDVFNEKYVDAAKSIGRADGFVGLFMEDHSIALSVLSAAANLGWLRLGKQVPRSPQKGLHLLSRLYNEEGFARGNSFTFATALDACSSLASLNAGKQIHAQVLRTSDTDGRQIVAVQTDLVDMYSRWPPNI